MSRIIKMVDEIKEYYNLYGIVDRLEDFSAPFRENCYIRGLASETREQAEQHDKELILLFKLHKWAEEHNGDWTPDWEECDDKFYVAYHYGFNCFQVCSNMRLNVFCKLPYFKSEEIARKFIEEFGDEIKEVLC